MESLGSDSAGHTQIFLCSGESGFRTDSCEKRTTTTDDSFQINPPKFSFLNLKKTFFETVFDRSKKKKFLCKVEHVEAKMFYFSKTSNSTIFVPKIDTPDFVKEDPWRLENGAVAAAALLVIPEWRDSLPFGGFRTLGTKTKIPIEIWLNDFFIAKLFFSSPVLIPNWLLIKMYFIILFERLLEPLRQQRQTATS